MTSRERVEKLIEDIWKYIRFRDESLAERVAEEIDSLTADKECLKELIKDPGLGERLFDALINYVRARYNYLGSVIEYGMLQGGKTLFSHKRIFEHTLKSRKFPVTQRARILGVSISALRIGILRLLSMRKPKVSKAVEEVSGTLPLFEYLMRKNDILKKAESELLKVAEKGITISEVLCGDRLRRARLAQGLVRLVSEGKVKLADGKLGELLERADGGR